MHQVNKSGAAELNAPNAGWDKWDSNTIHMKSREERLKRKSTVVILVASSTQYMHQVNKSGAAELNAPNAGWDIQMQTI